MNTSQKLVLDGKSQSILEGVLLDNLLLQLRHLIQVPRQIQETSAQPILGPRGQAYVRPSGQVGTLRKELVAAGQGIREGTTEVRQHRSGVDGEALNALVVVLWFGKNQ